jgi:transglutaminase-like putative cysteine protease
VILDITHRSRMQYPVPVLRSTNVVRLVPADGGTQHRLAYALTTEPAASVRTYEDAWGNTVQYFALAQPHFELVITARSRVETARPAAADGFVAWDEYRPDRLGVLLDLALETPLTDLGAAPAAEGPAEADAWAWVREQVASVRARLRYRKGTTRVTTTAADALSCAEGVCQDFAHVAIGLLRSRRIPARYAAGYQYLGPGAAGPHEPHAWIEVWHPAAGWRGFDPTTGAGVDDAYVRTAVGRDYNDAAPVRGHVVFATPTSPEAVPDPEVTVEIARVDGAAPNPPEAAPATATPPQSLRAL